MKTIIVCLLLSFGVMHASVQDTNDNLKAISEKEASSILATKEPHPESTFLDYMKWHIPRQGQRVANIELGYSSDFSLFEEAMKAKHGQEKTQDRGEGIFEDTILFSLRNSFIDWLDLSRFKKIDRPIEHIGAKFIKGSIGGTLEESRQDVLSPNPDDLESSTSWISDIFRDQVQFGIKALDVSPYGYLTLAVGSQYGEKPLLVLNSRIYSMLMKDETGIPRVKEEMIVPLGKRVQFSLGGSFYPTQFNQEGYENRISARILSTFDSIIAYTSVFKAENETLAVIGLSKTF